MLRHSTKQRANESQHSQVRADSPLAVWAGVQCVYGCSGQQLPSLTNVPSVLSAALSLTLHYKQRSYFTASITLTLSDHLTLLPYGYSY